MERLFPTRHPGTMHWCAVALDYLISTLRYNEITFMLLACRYWSLKLYLVADTFKDLIYVKHSSFFARLGREWGEKTAIHIYLFEAWRWPMARRPRLTLLTWIRNPSGMPYTSMASTPKLRQVLTECTSLVSQGWCLPQIIQWVVLKCAHWMSPGRGHVCWPGKKGKRPCKQLWMFKGNYLRDLFIFYFASFYTLFLRRS